MALVVSLVFLLVLTIIGISGMQTSTLEERMAGNTQEINRAFHSAESGIIRTLKEGDVLSTVASPGSPTTHSYQLDVKDSADKTIASTLTTSTYYEAASGKAPPSYSFEKFDTHNFVTVSTGTSPTGITSTHRQGFYIVGPKQD